MFGDLWLPQPGGERRVAADTSGWRARDAAKRPVMHRTAPTIPPPPQKKVSGPTYQ